MELRPDATDPEAERVLIELLRRTPTWKRAEQLAGLIHARNVLKVQRERLDLEYLREWAGRLGGLDLLEGPLGPAGLS